MVSIIIPLHSYSIASHPKYAYIAIYFPQNEIENIIQEFLVVRAIHPSSSASSSLIFMVFKKKTTRSRSLNLFFLTRCPLKINFQLQIVMTYGMKFMVNSPH